MGRVVESVFADDFLGPVVVGTGGQDEFHFVLAVQPVEVLPVGFVALAAAGCFYVNNPDDVVPE